MTARQIANVDPLKATSAELTTKRGLAMRFRSLLHGGTAEKLQIWPSDACRSGIHGMRRFVGTLRQAIEVAWNAGPERWSNGRTDGRVNRIKRLARSMYGRA